jgi:uncharacterized repeat protein (TIGR02543 family)
MLGYLNDLSDQGCTNYNSGLLNVAEIMDSYTRDTNKDLIVLFLTDGYPNEDVPNEKATYRILKEKYPYMTINGIQYEMGKYIIQEIIDISDNQWVADQDTLHNVLFDATVSPLTYDNFVITDYINDDYFYANAVTDIKVDRGEVTLTEENGVQKITWNLGDTYKTGDSIKMTIDLNLKEEYHNTKGYYPTNKSETIVSKLPDGSENTINSTLTPVLKNVYNVIYDANSPDECNIPSLETEEHYVYQNVTKKTESLSCPGYLFKGWVIDDNDKTDMTIINDDMFVMPGHDVHIKATWTKQELNKSMEGQVHEKITLYKVLQNEANIGTYAKKYTGLHQDSMDSALSTEDIYYWYASNATNASIINSDKNNVIFANHCWKMLRTTDTGGVKMIYNGEAINKKCLTNREKHLGYSGFNYSYYTGSYYYGTDYIYENGYFKLAGEVNKVTLNSSNMNEIAPTLIGKYTCKQTYSSGTCTSLIFIVDFYNSYIYTINVSNNSKYSSFGKIFFNDHSNNPSAVGYMYNHFYPVTSTGSLNNGSFGSYSASSSSIYGSQYYSDSIDFGNIEENKYTLINPHLISELTDYNELVGKYILSNGSSTSSDYAYYVVGVSGSTRYSKLLSKTDTSISMTIGDKYVDNLDGTYTVYNSDSSDPATLTYVDWYNLTSFSNYRKKYFCNGSNPTCTELRRFSNYTPTKNKIYYWSTKFMYKYSSDVEYTDGIYTLKGDIKTIWDIFDDTQKNLITTHHYTCLDSSTSCATVKYITYLDSRFLYYANLTNVNNIIDALDDMLTVYKDGNRINTHDSMIKLGIDAWYKKYIYNYFDEYIEDTIYCNNRSINDRGLWNPNGGSITSSYTYFTTINNLSCNNETDKFSTNNEKAKLTYKVGLATKREMEIMGNANLISTGDMYWLLTPASYNHVYNTSGNSWTYYVGSNGTIGSNHNSSSYGLRPVISLNPGITFHDGDGSMEYPYLIDDGTH